MKRIGAIILIVVCLLIGCAVDPPSYYFNAEEIIEKAIKIELVVCKNARPINVTIEKDTMLQFDNTNAIVVEELDKEKIDDFAYDLSTIIFHVENESVNAPLGYTILIHTKDYEIIVISHAIFDNSGYAMVAKFTSEGNFIEHIAQFADAPSFKKLLHKYFEVQ